MPDDPRHTFILDDAEPDVGPLPGQVGHGEDQTSITCSPFDSLRAAEQRYVVTAEAAGDAALPKARAFL